MLRGLFTTVVFLLLIGSAHSHCPDAWITFGSSCYFFGHDDLTFLDAQHFCEHFHANLANIETSVENKFIQNHASGLKAPNHWFGLTDEVIEDVWKHYPSETTANFLDFGSGQPNQHQGANCVAIWASFNYQWVDEPCTNKFKPLCEKPVQGECEIVG